MMLNILMTFAQFEREVIAERIRDKLSTSKKKGKYVGGLLPLGYRGDSVNMKMVIEPEEAKIVRLIYDEYLRTSSPKAVQRLLEGKGIRGREWVSKKGLRHGGRPLSIAVIRDILQNPIYICKLRYRGKVYDGEHEGIIPVKLWERVQSTFKANSESCHQRSGRDLKPFAGLIYCGHCNAPMFVATVTKPNGRRYRYYICHVDEKRAHRECPLHRVPAETLEQLLLNRIAALLKTPTMLAKICGGELRNALDTRQAGEALENIATLWSAMFPVERYKLIHAFIQRVLVFENEVRIVFRAEGIAGLLKEAGADFSVSSGSVDLECVLTVPCKLRRYAGQVKLHSADEQADGPRLPIQTALIQAHQGMEQIISGGDDHAADRPGVEHGPFLRGPDAPAGEPRAGHREGDMGKPPAGQSHAGQTPPRHPRQLGRAAQTLPWEITPNHIRIRLSRLVRIFLFAGMGMLTEEQRDFRFQHFPAGDL